MFDANGTEGLEVFTWVVAFILSFVGALVAGHSLTVIRKDKKHDEELEEEAHKAKA